MIFSDYDDLLDDSTECPEYNQYLTEHIANVKRGYEFLREHLPEVLDEHNYVGEDFYYGELDEIIENHDSSKYRRCPNADSYYELTCEYDPYVQYFYGTSKTPDIEEAFDRAWLAHTHANPHHWQHWVLHRDDGETTIIDMPYVFIIEMLTDWWSFSWKAENLYEIFNWYEEHKESMILSDKTQKTVESILDKLHDKLEEVINYD